MIIDFKKCCDFEIIGQRSLKVIESGIPFDRLRMVFCYYPTVALSIFETFDLELRVGTGGKKTTVMGLQGRERSSTIS